MNLESGLSESHVNLNSMKIHILKFEKDFEAQKRIVISHETRIMVLGEKKEITVNALQICKLNYYKNICNFPKVILK